MKFDFSSVQTLPTDILRKAFSLTSGLLSKSHDPDLLTVPFVDLERFMGPWYVQSHTPLVIDDHSSDQVETYSLKPDGRIAVRFEFKRFGRTFTLHPEGEVVNKRTGAHWTMRFLKVLPGPYLIVRLKDDYSLTAVSTADKRFVWIMARSKTIPEALYQEVFEDLKRDGYRVDSMRRVPQS